jgi:hypothetical protein
MSLAIFDNFLSSCIVLRPVWSENLEARRLVNLLEMLLPFVEPEFLADSSSTVAHENSQDKAETTINDTGLRTTTYVFALSEWAPEVEIALNKLLACGLVRGFLLEACADTAWAQYLP